MTGQRNHQIAIEHVPVARSEAVCSCGWKGGPKMFIEWAESDGERHLAEPNAAPRRDPLAAMLDPIAKRHGLKGLDS